METKREFRSVEEALDEENVNNDLISYSIPELKQIHLYLLVLGYAIKFYLNDPMKIKPYEEHLKNLLPNFFPNLFNKWARKYGN